MHKTVLHGRKSSVPKCQARCYCESLLIADLKIIIFFLTFIVKIVMILVLYITSLKAGG